MLDAGTRNLCCENDLKQVACLREIRECLGQDAGHTELIVEVPFFTQSLLVETSLFAPVSPFFPVFDRLWIGVQSLEPFGTQVDAFERLAV